MPNDFIEQLFVADLVEGEWELRRLRHTKVQIVKMAYRPALRSLIQKALDVYDNEYLTDLANRWFTNKAVKKEILAALNKFGLNETVIDAEALRDSMQDLRPIEQRIAELESRRDKILRRIEDHRVGLATQVQANSACLDERTAVPVLVSRTARAD